MVHRRSPLTPEGRRRLVALVIEDRWSQRRAAERFQVSPATASKWVNRHRADLREALRQRISPGRHLRDLPS